MRRDPSRRHIAGVDVYAPPGVSLFEQPYSDKLFGWRLATWGSLDAFMAQERPAAEAEELDWKVVRDLVPPRFHLWMAEALEAHADALAELAESQRRRNDERFARYAEQNVFRARRQRATAAALAEPEVPRESTDGAVTSMPVGHLFANEASGAVKDSDDPAHAHRDLAASVDLVVAWSGSRERIEDQLISAALELARRKRMIEESRSYRATAWLRSLGGWLRQGRLALAQRSTPTTGCSGRLCRGALTRNSAFESRSCDSATHIS